MQILHFSILILFLFFNCNSPRYDRVEYLKRCLTEYGFHPDTTNNVFKEYLWKINTSENDSLLQREAEFYLLDTVYYNHSFFKPEKYCYLKILEYQYFPLNKKEYAEEYFPGNYEKEEKKAQFFEQFYNLSKGLRHLVVPGSITLLKKITLKNRYVLLIAKLERENVTDTTKARDLLETLKDGIEQSTKENAQLKYSQIRVNTLVQNNLLAGKTCT